MSKAQNSTKKSLTTIKPGMPTDSRPYRWTFDENEIRRSLQPFFDSENSDNYKFALFQTIASRESVKVLSQHVSVIDNGKNKIRLRKKGERPGRVREDDNESKALYFGQNVMEIYLNALREMIKSEDFVGNSYACYPLVQTRGINDLEMPSEFDSWPVVHVVKGADSKTFKRLVRELNSDRAYRIISKGYVPNEISLLRKLDVQPLSVTREFQADGHQLRKMIDFFVPYTITKEFED